MKIIHLLQFGAKFEANLLHDIFYSWTKTTSRSLQNCAKNDVLRGKTCYRRTVPPPRFVSHISTLNDVIELCSNTPIYDV